MVVFLYLIFSASKKELAEEAKAIAGWDKAASRGELFDDRGELSRLIGRPTTLLEKAVADALDQNSAEK